MGDVYQFLDEDTNIDNPGDWVDQITGMPGTVPGPNDVAIIEYGQSLTGTLNVSAFELLQGSSQESLSLTGASTQITATTGAVAGIAVLDDGAGLTVDTLELLGGGTALILQNGASVSGNSLDAASITIGTTSGASLLSVSGFSTNFNYSSANGYLAVGGTMSSSATISISNGGAMVGTYGDAYIGAAAGSSGTMIISDAGSAVEFNNLVEIGDYGQGKLLVEKGGYISLGGGSGVDLGEAANPDSPGSGTITVTGPSSLISVNGELDVGESNVSLGVVSVQAGGEMQVSADTFILDGNLDVTGAGSIFEGRMLVVESTYREAGLTVSSGGSVSVVTLSLYYGAVALAGGDISVRRSGYIDPGTKISGYGTVSVGAIYNDGLLDASGGTLRFIGPINDKGAAHIEAGATLQLDGTVGSSQTVTFESATGSLALGDAGGFAGVIAGFTQGDTIDLLGVAATKLSFRGGKLTVSNGNAHVAVLNFGGKHIAGDFKLGSDGHGGSTITYSSASALPAIGATNVQFSHFSPWHLLPG
jgi:T5SS/PEP-CTERM-associated repeat protein